MKYYYDKGRHLVCLPYSVENLHLMAKDLGIKRSWFHNKKGKEHYDIPRFKWIEVALRATKVSSKIILLIIKEQLVNGEEKLSDHN